ncbi:hypothetical protein I79_002272 [Cricetulus griseus]|uniref:Uncharacterized protein n=1 Tax=Cricetulus griseus TaxID=10029 RepID=G3GWY5_CRIGR|nr:hypothetical protein I79_002272 [Cricetulus griseus]
MGVASLSVSVIKGQMIIDWKKKTLQSSAKNLVLLFYLTSVNRQSLNNYIYLIKLKQTCKPDLVALAFNTST